MDNKESRRLAIIKENGLAMLGQYANDPLVAGLEEKLRAQNLTKQDYYRNSVVEIINWSGLLIDDVRNALTSSSGDYAQDVLQSLQNL